MSLRLLRQPVPHALAYADFVPVKGRVAFPDLCCDLVVVGSRVYLNGPEIISQPNPFDGLRFQLLRLDPFSVRSWLGIPLASLVNRFIPLADIAADLELQVIKLVEIGQFHRMHDHFEVSSSPLPPVGRVRSASQLLARGMSVRMVADAVDISERQLERLFVSEFGITPREWTRTFRFRAAALAARRGETLAQAAALAGFADQAHFTRVSSKLKGKTPRELIAQHVGIVQDVEAGQF